MWLKAAAGCFHADLQPVCATNVRSDGWNATPTYQDLVSRAVKSASEAGASAQGNVPAADKLPDDKAPVILERSKHQLGAPPTNVGGISACAQGDLEMAMRLACNGWDAASAVDKHGNTPLMWAAGAGHQPVVLWLVQEVKVDIEDSNKQGRTALMWAAKNGQLHIVDWLLHTAPPPRARADTQMKDGSRAFDWAVYGGHLPTLQLLASNSRVDMHALNNYGCGAAFWAAASGNVGPFFELFVRHYGHAIARATELNTARSRVGVLLVHRRSLCR